MANFQIGRIAYQSRLRDGETQTFVLKRLLPTFATLLGCRTAIAAVKDERAEKDGGEDEAKPAGLQDILMPVARELALLSNEDVQFIINACLQVTKRQVSNGIGWVDVMQRGVVQDEADTKFITRLTIAWHVLGENFGDMLGSFGLDIETISKAAPAALG